MKKILILGAGKIGRMAAVMLKESGEYAVTLADSNGAMLEFCAKDDAATLIKVDVTDEAALTEVATGHDAILSTCPFYLNVAIARVAREVGASYFDVTEDVETTRAIRETSKVRKVPLSRNVVWRRASFRLPRMTCSSALTRSKSFAFVLVPCRKIRPTV